MIESTAILNVDGERGRAVVYCKTDRKKAYLCLMVRRRIGVQGHNDYWCFYAGIDAVEYARAYESEAVRSDKFSYIGIAGDAIFVQSLIADTVLMSSPEYFIGSHTWIEDMEGTTGVTLLRHVTELCEQVDELLYPQGESK